MTLNQDQIAEAFGVALPLHAAIAEVTIARGVCADIQRIMAEYRKQEAEGGVDTPGGLEHMGDVWKLLSEWDTLIELSRKRPVDRLSR